VGSNRTALDAGREPPARIDGSPGALLIATDFAADEGLWDRQRLIPGATVTFGALDPAARDGTALVLRLPGIPGLGPTDHAGPDLATQISTKQFAKFGSLRAGVRFAACAPGEEVASAAFAYFNDGGDLDGNGLPDNPELDFQVLCGRPSFIVLSAWKDFAMTSNGTARFLKMSHAVDTSTGDTYDLVSPSDATYAKTSTDRALMQPGFPDPNVFYEVGFDWQPTSVRFFAVLGGKELTLWTLTDEAYVPAVPLQVMFNLWHPASHWLPDRTSAAYPAQDANLRVDWVEYRAR
jgi:hypothetical protein